MSLENSPRDVIKFILIKILPIFRNQLNLDQPSYEIIIFCLLQICQKRNFYSKSVIETIFLDFDVKIENGY